MRRITLAGVALGLIAAVGVVAPAQAQPISHHARTATVSALHAIPNTPVDVYLGKTRILNDFKPGTLAGPLKVPAGHYTLRITAATATSYRHPILGPVRYSFGAGRNYTVVAHLTAAGRPTVTKYRNRTAGVASGSGRLTVRHDAAAPAVDVLLNGAVAMQHLRNPHESRAIVPAGTYSTAVALTGTTQPVIGPADVMITDQVNTIVYAWGSAKDGNLAVAVQTVPLSH